MSFAGDRLDEVRSVARARAQEDFQYFAERVLGLRIEASLGERIQHAVLHGEPMPDLARSAYPPVQTPLERAVAAWHAVVHGELVQRSPSETFSWLFGELIQRRAA